MRPQNYLTIMQNKSPKHYEPISDFRLHWAIAQLFKCKPYLVYFKNDHLCANERRHNNFGSTNWHSNLIDQHKWIWINFNVDYWMVGIVNVGQLLIFSITTMHAILMSLGVLGNNSWLYIGVGFHIANYQTTKKIF